MSAVAATPADLDALEGAAQPVYAQLEKAPDTRALIAAIRELKATTRATRTARPPVGCAEAPATTSGRELPASTINGTYHWRITWADASAAMRAVGGPAVKDEDIGTVGKMTLRDGKWRMGDEDPEAYSGTYKIVGKRLVFEWRDSILTFAYTRDADKTIHLWPIPPMDPGDAGVMAGGPWRYVGPPVRDIP